MDAVKNKPIGYWQEGSRRLLRNPAALAGLILLSLLILLALFAPIFSSHSYYEINLEHKNEPPGAKFWFGSDELGRDLFTRIWWGARISLIIGISAPLIDLIIGVFYGSIAGGFGGKVDEVMMRFADILYSIPYLLIVILLMVFIESGLWSILIALTLTGWISMARIVRGQMIQLKEMEFVKAAQVFGASKLRILFKHMLPNCIGPIIVTVTLTIPIAIFTEAFLSFLGLGIQAPIASLGTMASDGLPALRYYPWRLFFPAGFISLTMIAFNLLGDGFRDTFDPRLRI